MAEDCQGYITANSILKPSPTDELKIAHDEAVTNYTSEMNEFVTLVPDETELKNYHVRAMKTAMQKYKSFDKKDIITAENIEELEEV
jgi:ribosome biogenesis GTPase A